MKKIKIKYFTEEIEKLAYIDGKSDWIDLRAAQSVDMKAGEFKLQAHTAVRFCTSWSTTDSDVDALIADIQKL